MVFIGLNEFLKFGILGIFGLNLKTGTSQKKNVPQLIQVYTNMDIVTCHVYLPWFYFEPSSKRFVSLSYSYHFHGHAGPVRGLSIQVPPLLHLHLLPPLPPSVEKKHHRGGDHLGWSVAILVFIILSRTITVHHSSFYLGNFCNTKWTNHFGSQQKKSCPIPYAPCMEYLPTFGSFLGWM